MKLATPKQLKERWLTPEGKKVRQQIIDNITEDNWERFLKGFPYVEENTKKNNLKFIDLRGINFYRANLINANFKEVSLSDTNFKGAFLDNANFEGAFLEGINFENAYFKGVNFKKAHFGVANFKGAYLTKKSMEEVKYNFYEKIPFRRTLHGIANLQGIKSGIFDLYKIPPEGVNFEETFLEKANFEGAILEETSFKRASLKNANFNNANFQIVNFNDVFLEGTDFEGANFRRINFNRVNFSRTNFKNTQLYEVNFIKDQLWDTNFDESKILNVTFNDCDFNDCIFKSSRIMNVDWGNIEIRKEYFENLKPFNFLYGGKNYNKLTETYISLKNQFNKFGYYNDMSWAYLKEKESLRFHYKQNFTRENRNNFINRTKYFFRFLWEYFLFLLFGYGEKPWHILGWSVLTIILFGFLFKIPNMLGTNIEINNGIISYWHSFYFSTITFTTVGFGDFFPMENVPRILVMIEAAVGLFFYSLFIFTFGKRIAGR